MIHLQFKIYYSNEGKNDSMSEYIFTEPLDCVLDYSNYYVNKKRAVLKIKPETDEILNYLIDQEIENGEKI
jgi:hypothetical protein